MDAPQGTIKTMLGMALAMGFAATTEAVVNVASGGVIQGVGSSASPPSPRMT